MKRLILPALSFLLLSMVAFQVDAQKPRFPFSKPKTQNQESLMLSERAGPWLIMCTSFSGENALEQGRRLAMELRKDFRLPAYVYQKEFDFSKDIANKGRGWEVMVDQHGEKGIRPIRMEAAGKAKFEEVAVLVGNFKSVDESKAQSTLKHIKSINPKALDFDIVSDWQGDDLAGERLRAWRGFASASTQKSGGSMRTAFMLPNPLIPDEFFEARKVDDYILKDNKKYQYSLLKNPGVYSVKVASFRGSSTDNLNEIEEIKKEQAWRLKTRQPITSSKMIDAMKKATILCRELRRQGHEAYEFHDRFESYVCVGSFDWLTQKDATGQQRSNQEVLDMIVKFRASVVNLPGRPGAFQSYKLPDKIARAGIACDAQPLPVLVPKAPARTSKRFLGKLR